MQKQTPAKKKSKGKGMSKSKMLAIGAGVAAASAGAYYFLGPKGKQHQKKAKALMVKMEREAKTKIKTAKDMAEPMYHKAVDMLAVKYSKEYAIHEKEINALAKRLKGEYKRAINKVKSSPKKSTASRGKKRA